MRQLGVQGAGNDIYVIRRRRAAEHITGIPDEASTRVDTQASFSPGGSRIAFWFGTGTGLGSDSEIFVMGADGSNPTNLTNNHVGDIRPFWGPARAKNAIAQAN